MCVCVCACVCVCVCVCVWCMVWCGVPPFRREDTHPLCPMPTSGLQCCSALPSEWQQRAGRGGAGRGGAGQGGSVSLSCNLSCRMRQPKLSRLFIVLIHSSLHRTPPRTHPSQPADRRHRGLVSDRTHTPTHTHILACTHTHAHPRTDTRMYTHAHTHTRMYTHTRAPTHRYSHVHTHTHAHTCSHTIPSSGPHLRKQPELLSTAVTATTSQMRSPNLAMTVHAYFMCTY